MKRNAFGLLAKYPAPGIVKTRLARDIGETNAAQVYKSIAERVFRQTAATGRGYERVLFYTPLSDRKGFENWLPGERLLPQRGKDLGEVMANALRDLFAGGAVKAAIAGVDIPEVDGELVRDAFDKLESADVVLGPATDGGYYLIGMKTLRDEIFRCISWSTEKVFSETIRIIEGLRLTYATVRTLSDVDRIEDIVNCRERRT